MAEALRSALETVDVSILIEYANRMENRSLGSRLGYLLEIFGQAAEGLARSTSPVKLDPTRARSGRTVTQWQVAVNMPDREIAAMEGVG